MAVNVAELKEKYIRDEANIRESALEDGFNEGYNNGMKRISLCADDRYIWNHPAPDGSEASALFCEFFRYGDRGEFPG